MAIVWWSLVVRTFTSSTFIRKFSLPPPIQCSTTTVVWMCLCLFAKSSFAFALLRRCLSRKLCGECRSSVFHFPIKTQTYLQPILLPHSMPCTHSIFILIKCSYSKQIWKHFGVAGVWMGWFRLRSDQLCVKRYARKLFSKLLLTWFLLFSKHSKIFHFGAGFTKLLKISGENMRNFCFLRILRAESLNNDYISWSFCF